MNPSTASSIDGSESSCQKPASAASPRTRSAQARFTVAQTSVRTTARRLRTDGAAGSDSPTAVTTRPRYGVHSPVDATLVGMASTHTVDNQPPPLTGYDVFTADEALVEGVQRHEAGWAQDRLTTLGRLAGSEQSQEWGRLANVHPPV